MTDNFRDPGKEPSIPHEARHDEALSETLERLRAEVVDLRASRERLVLGADDDRRKLERELHEGVQQQLVALAVGLQLAEAAVGTDAAATKTLLEELARDVQQALDEAARLAQRIYAPQLEVGGLAAALRAAAVTADVPASVEVSAAASLPTAALLTVYLCWLEALEHRGGGKPATITVGEEDGALTFEVVTAGPSADAKPDRMRDRVEALGGRLTVRSEPGSETHVHVSLPLSP